MVHVLVFLVCLLMTAVVYAADEGAGRKASEVEKDMDTIANRLRDEQIARAASYRRYARRQGQQRTSPADRVRAYLEQQHPDGSWPEINYQDRARTHWSPARHTRVLLTLAGAYRAPDSGLTGDEALKSAILSGLAYWVDQDPQSDNWWFNCINTPRDLGRVLLLMEDTVPEGSLQKAEKIIRRSSFKRTGANLIWEAGNLLVLACVVRDAELLAASPERMVFLAPRCFTWVSEKIRTSLLAECELVPNRLLQYPRVKSLLNTRRVLNNSEAQPAIYAIARIYFLTT